MEVRDMNMEELEARVSELDALVEAAEDVEAVERAKEELAQIAERRAELVEIETRKAEAEALNRGAEVPDILIEKREETKMDEMIYTRDSREYRNAFLNNLRGVELSEVEQRAFAVAGSAIATETANDIMQVIRDHAPILDKLTVVYSPAKVAYYVEGDIKDAESHVENAAITAAADTLVKVDL
ncbi:MAG: phage major capsid protein, partial [Bacteroidaceae bacterium]|nr:phage major capsid protein [Bacteroidaceae bacterium]